MSGARPGPDTRGAALRVALRILHALLIAHQLLADLLACGVHALRGWAPFLAGPAPRHSRGRRPPPPTTAALVVAEQSWAGEAALDALASVVRWCSAAGLQQIQLYDPAGEAKRAAAALRKRLNFDGRAAYRVEVGFSGSSQAPKNGTTHVERDVTVVRLLDGQDAVAPLLAAAQLRQPGTSAGVQEADAEGSVTAATLTASIQRAAGGAAVQQPELVLVFGPARTLAGFPPWLARHSEIHAAGRLADASEPVVARSLARYCRTSQRFGT